MSKNLKKRIEDLMLRTDSNSVLESCKTAISKFNEYAVLNLPSSVMEKMEETIAEDFLRGLSDEKAILEFSDIAINNLGVRSGYSELTKLDTTKNLPLKYVLEKIGSFINQPEWLIYEQFISILKPFDFEPSVNECIYKIKINANKYAEDLKIHRLVFEASKSNSSYLIGNVKEEIDNYLGKRTPSARNLLIEKLNKYIFDPTIRNLYNVIVESAQKFEIKATSNDAIIQKIYSPTFVTNESETFVVHGKVYRKEGNEIIPLTEHEISYLPKDFITVANFINQPNVEVSENLIKIFSKDKKVSVFENESGNILISINEKTVNPAEFEKIYLASGLYNHDEINTLRNVKAIIENWSNIFEVDYVKSIYSKAYPNRRADVFRCGNKLHINTVDTLMNENLFYHNCTAHQSRNHILEFVNYDLALTFDDLLSPEKRRISILESKKDEFSQGIRYFEAKKDLLESAHYDEFRNTSEFRDLLRIVEEELNQQKRNYFEIQTELNNLNKISEGVGFNVGDTVEYLKKKLQ